MFTSVASFFSVTTQQGLYARIIDFSKQYVKPATIDLVEIFLISALTQGLISAGLNRFPFYTQNANILSSICLGFFGLIGPPSLYHKYIKNPFITQKLQDIIQNSQGNSQSMLVFRTTNDWNKSLENHQTLDNYQKLGKKYSIEILKVNSEAQLKSALELNNRKYDRIEFQAHASQTGIELAPQTNLTKSSKWILTWLDNHIKDNGIIGLDCCSTGKGHKNIALAISRACSGSTVYAATGSINGGWGTEYGEDTIPSFNDGLFWKGKDITRMYRNGAIVEESNEKNKKNA
ncbi:MAG: hypothetical protein ACD_17C00037G0002 [uncultured bacterium]|nr:MAG: hypothetical protein ACD_17C00037G0002 [uncultured bacterium]OGN56870.1 MAG: hypothetical protein A2796_06780 [Chlamydiae bacterium RIFCSPHIGHO2_01_FULL_44_39]OGN59528.1 MAG: hypothetical protein A3D96_07470 [Chlamydiae bacterium RIFCSPHIGHO2_12_FULL_44_59]OGN67273.1 MAG: hypothetical protein A2978_03300 [Chlamydiae bacterium RIFCSPLOWO2_01_FULL_44_52]OGN68695.1 MAG: hypothetical protein A3I67_03030 [Chlamydiae bacterium RIFCSPLOWO2_02_FULL_45_22]OGN69216.1 MAG: hypothetical protein A3